MPALLAAIALAHGGCGVAPGMADTDAGTAPLDASEERRDAGSADASQRDASVDGGPAVECMDLADCPARPCETAFECVEGRCAYELFRCASPGVCPQLACQAVETATGELTNTCVEVSDASCGVGGFCVGSECVVSTAGFHLAEGGLRTGSVHGEIRASGGRLFTHRGHLGFVTPRLAPRGSGSFTLTGGLRL